VRPKSVQAARNTGMVSTNRYPTMLVAKPSKTETMSKVAALK
jgi:hypothetical protein